MEGMTSTKRIDVFQLNDDKNWNFVYTFIGILKL